MAKKRAIKKRKVARRFSRTTNARRPAPSFNYRQESGDQRRVDLVTKNLITFIILFVLSVIFYSISTTGSITNNLFLILSILLGFVSAALLIVLLVFLFMRAIRR
jgi:heme/copper-type cytochrome/quinol oxidase subunit 4